MKRWHTTIFRRERWDEFWKWMRAALEHSYGDRRLAFDLCWRVTQDSKEVLRRAIPDQHEVLATYLSYTMDLHREARPFVDALSRVSGHLVHLAVFDGRQAIVIHRVSADSGTPLTLIEAAPVHCTSVGKAILAFAPEGLRCSIEAPFTEKLGALVEVNLMKKS